MLNSGKKNLLCATKKNKYSNSCVVRNFFSEMEQINITPYDWVVVLVFHLLTQYVVVL
jgi:hypothetical protein